jgi:hypothetical protein
VLEFYRGPRARITTDIFEVRGVGACRFALCDLSSVRIVLSQPHAGDGRVFRCVSSLVAALIVVPVIGPVSRVVAGLLATGLLLHAGFSGWPRRSRWQLVGVYQGKPVVLFTSSDQREFDQMRRGLQRCMDYRRLLG